MAKNVNEPVDDVIASVHASPGRRVFGVGAIGLLGVMAFYIALSHSPSDLGWLAFLLIVGAGSMWMAWRMWVASEHVIELTETELRSSDGTLISLVADIEDVDRGMFAFKPSNGFLLRLKAPKGRAFNPGMWWRMGRRVGIGGVTPGSQSKTMADVIAAMIISRQSPE